MVYSFRYVSPGSVDELLQFLDEQHKNKKKALVLNGGTDLLVNIRAGLEKPDYVVDMKRIKDLHQLQWDAKRGLEIGATVTVNEVVDYEAVRKHYQVFHAAESMLADFQLRNRATVTGNLVTASPCGDSTSPLLTLGASLVIRSVDGSRTVPVLEFITGVKQTILKPNEIVEKVLIPADTADGAGGYKKLKRIKGHDLGLVMVAMYKKSNRMRFAIGSAAPGPILLDEMPGDTPVVKVQEAAQAAISPIDDVRASAEYRRAMVNAYIEQLMEEVK